MRRIPLLIACFLVTDLGAAALTIPEMPAPLFADQESSVSMPLPAPCPPEDGYNIFRLELSFVSTPSNCVQVALGRDTSPADGALAAEETCFVFGYDCGEWFLRTPGLRRRFTVPAAPIGSSQELTLRIRIHDEPGASAVTLRADDMPVDFDLAGMPPLSEWMVPATWDMLRITSRGADFPDSALRAAFERDGTFLFLR